ncbi:MAG: hydroxyacid dehydrogenase [Candidatus Saccharibacteria bacterium]|nr:hydroxyacid dehydrogenase [Pseudorhodobacter sp.]
MADRPLILAAPEPRSIDTIFTADAKAQLFDRYRIVEVAGDAVADLPSDLLAEARYVLGQPPIPAELLARMPALRAVLNVESNLLPNMPYDLLFQRGIHTLTTGAVFAEPVAEIGLAFALTLLRDVVEGDLAFREGRELWGFAGNGRARLLGGSKVGLIGFGDLGRALNRLLVGFRAEVSAYDPWLPPSVLRDHGVRPCGLDDLLETSDVVFCVASVTGENEGFLGATHFARMKPGAAFILLSRAGVVDFPALMAAVAAGHILAASDVYPEEPLPLEHPVRGLKGFLRSAHRAGALDVAMKRMGDMVLEDMDLMDRGLPPLRCKRAERETATKMRSRPVDQT